jgi:peptidoglycan/LPS O-acetylase OafA/YrhL
LHGWQRLDGIDLLRGLAIFLVLMNHVNMRLRIAKIPFASGLSAQAASSLFWNGQRGVQIFFAISGFLIASTTLRRWGSLHCVAVSDFYRLRFARIAPLLLLLLIVLSGLHAAQVKNFVVPPKTGGIGGALLAALTFRVNVLEAQRGYLPANWDILWSLSVEEMFYLFFPLVCRALGRGRLLWALLLTFAALGPVARAVFAQGNEVWREYSYLGGMEAIALGCLTALLLSHRRLSGRTARILGAAGAALLVFCLCFSRIGASIGLERTGLDMSILALGTCMTIAWAAQAEWRSPKLLAPLLAMGQRSYEIYLTHMFVVFALFTWFLNLGKPMAAVPLLFLATIAIAAVLGEAVARCYSEPMNRWLRARWLSRPIDSVTGRAAAH